MSATQRHAQAVGSVEATLATTQFTMEPARVIELLETDWLTNQLTDRPATGL